MIRTVRRRFYQISISNTWDLIRTSFWFTPLVMTIFAILLSRIFLYIDAKIPNEILQSRRLVLTGTSADVRYTLIQMAVTTLATAGVVFSLLTVPLSTVASQYGSRLLRVFRRDRTTQFVLGMFTGTFFYCLMAAFELPPPGTTYDLPQLTATFALVLFVAAFATLIALIQHITTTLQAPSVIAAAAGELTSVVRGITSESNERDDYYRTSGNLPIELAEDRAYQVLINQTGYIQSIDLDEILQITKEANLIVHILEKSGQFVFTGKHIALVWPDDHVSQQLAGRLRRCFLIGRQRTPTQDLVYAINQLVEIALRSMSPAINDPFSAMTCIDHLSANLTLLAEHESSQPQYTDSHGQLRLIIEPVTFKELIAAAFDMLRHASCDNATVLLKILDALEKIGQKIHNVEQCKQLAHQVKLVRAESEVGNLISDDRQAIQQRCEVLIQNLEGGRTQ